MTSKKHKKENLGIILCLLFFCEPFISVSLPVFSYYDEIVVMSFLLYALFSGIKNIKKNVFAILLAGLLLIVITLTYNIIYNIQNSNIAILLDAFNCSKFFIVAICCEQYLKNIDADFFVMKIGRVFKAITYLLLVPAIVSIFVDIGMRDEARYGLHAFKFLCENAGQFNYCCYFIVAILTAYYFVMPRQSFIPICAALVLFALTLRARTFVFIGMYLFLFVYFTKAKKISKYVVGIFAFISVPLFYTASFAQISKYFNNDNVARSRLLTDGIKVFKEYFPWGTGFATFGTAQAASHYTPLYYKYGLNTVWGLYPNNPVFASDSFWPSIITQFGAIGTCIYIFMLWVLFQNYKKKFINNKFKLSFYFIIMIVVLSSTVTAAFYHYTTIGMILFVSIISQGKGWR